ncbi:hypothetical protein ACI2IX_19960 [Leifsonia aquatica]|uniref:hypothetical protein n=1 Tax=Leifsonia aquatica TaxID=144185 RepID=UPI00384FEC78
MRLFPHTKALVLLTVVGLAVQLCAASPSIPAAIGTIAGIITVTSFLTLIGGIIAGITASFRTPRPQNTQEAQR